MRSLGEIAALESLFTALTANPFKFFFGELANKFQSHFAPVFKNPPGDHAARLIEQVCGKQMRVGGARISEVHANFIVAEDDARADDVYTLLRRIQRMVREDTGVELEPELKLIGEFEEVPDGSHRG